MNLLVLTALYPPEPVVSARTSADLAAVLHERGHGVTVLAPYPSRPSGKPYPGYTRRLYSQETQQGVNIIRCLSAASSESSLSSRMWENLTFGLTSSWRLLWLRPKPQAVYANTWPLLAQGLLALAARLRRIPWLLNVQDIYPESLSAQGRLDRGSWLFRLLQRLDTWIARCSAGVVVIGERFARAYRQERRLPPEKVHVIPNWIEAEPLLADFSRLDGQPNPIRRRLGLAEGDFLSVYAGNIGAGAGVESLIQAVRLLGDENRLHLLVAGEGTNLAACQNLASDLKLERVHFLSPWPAGDTAAVLSAAELLLLPTRGDQSLASLPSKLAYYLLAGRPILTAAAANTDLAETVLDANCGWLVPPDDLPALADGIRQAIHTPLTQLHEFGVSARAYALAHFTRQANLPRLVDLLESLASPDSSLITHH